MSAISIATLSRLMRGRRFANRKHLTPSDVRPFLEILASAEAVRQWLHSPAPAIARDAYARVSTDDQSLNLQLDALKETGCRRVFEETASGAQKDRPQLREAIKFLKHGDTLVVWKLDRLARSLSQLIETVEALHNTGCGLRSLTEAIDTTTTGVAWSFTYLVR